MLESFYHAFHGMFVALKEQRNLRIHLGIAAVVVAAGIYLRVDLYCWFALAFAIGMVLTAELVNTSIEHAVDLSAEGEFHPAARLAKDTAAAAVLIASLTAVAIGLLVFVPKILPIVQPLLLH